MSTLTITITIPTLEANKLLGVLPVTEFPGIVTALINSVQGQGMMHTLSECASAQVLECACGSARFCAVHQRQGLEFDV